MSKKLKQKLCKEGHKMVHVTPRIGKPGWVCFECDAKHLSKLLEIYRKGN